MELNEFGIKWNCNERLIPTNFVKHYSMQITLANMVQGENIKKEDIEALKSGIETKVNRKPHSPNDFKFISEEISNQTKEYISYTTLMRMWGYVNEDVKTRVSTLNILSRFLNYRDFDSFIESQSHKEEESKRLFSDIITVNELEKGTHVELKWNPNKRCEIEYLGDNKFIVKASENSKLKADAKFSCSHIIQNQPLYLFDLEMDGEIIKSFQVGAKSGIVGMKIL